MPTFDDSVNRVQGIAGVLIGATIIAVVIRWVLEFVSEYLHWSVAALLALGLTIAAIWFTHQVKTSWSSSATSVIAILATGLLTVAVVGAWISFTLHVSHRASYVVPAKYTLGTFVDFYVYTFLDLLPGIEVWDTLSVKPPIEAKDARAGLPLLGFKIFVVWLFLDAYRTWRRGPAQS